MLMNSQPKLPDPATRDDLASLIKALWEPLRPHFSPGGARVSLGAFAAHFPQGVAELEGFARPLWGLAPLAAGGFDFDHWDIYLSGLEAGSDPDHPEYWGEIGHFDQRSVEAAAIGFALALAPETFWNPLPDRARQRLADWLRGPIGHGVHTNNWNYFRVLCALGLKRVGVDVDWVPVEESLEKLESYYLANGWYRDGETRQMDHYIGFAMQFYGLLYAVLNGDDDPDRAERLKDRARKFAPHHACWYADDGAALPMGRSLTYRFAHAGFWGAHAFADVGGVSMERAKGLALGNIRWWMENGRFDRDGVLPVGYGYPNLMMSESYNSAGSPYWSFKAFLPLALPDDHAFWQAEEQPDTQSTVTAQPEIGMVVMREPGQVTALTGGQEGLHRFRWGAEKYGKFAYSTRYGFSIETAARVFPTAAVDNMLAFSIDGNDFFVRSACEDVRMDGDTHYSRWSPVDGVQVETWMIPRAPGHIRVHRIQADRDYAIAEGGFAVNKEVPLERNEVSDRAMISGGGDVSIILALENPSPRSGAVIDTPPNTNLIHPRALVPQLRGTIEAGETILMTAVAATPNELPTGPEWASFIRLPDLKELDAMAVRATPVIGWARPIDPTRVPGAVSTTRQV